MALLKDLYSNYFYQRLAVNLEKVIVGFNRIDFINKIYVRQFDDMELKQRMRHTTTALRGFLSPSYSDSIAQLVKLIEQLRNDNFGEDQLAMMFLLKYFDRMMIQMQLWSHHTNSKVRRLASEGCRPALPWGMAVPNLKKDPSLILPILENLKSDLSESVRRSVANNLNDISKNQPTVVLEIAARWKGLSSETDAIIKHGCRTLLKQGHKDILTHYGLESTHFELINFDVKTPEIRIGGDLEFSFIIKNTTTLKQTVRLEYAVYYKRLNGSDSKKVFKISERDYEPELIQVVNRKQSFRLITTRKFYPGQHYVSIIINGLESDLAGFELV